MALIGCFLAVGIAYWLGYHAGKEDERYRWKYFFSRWEDDDGKESEEEA